MTREEAIEFGEMWLEINEDSKNSNTYKFFQKAIKALEQEPRTGYWIYQGVDTGDNDEAYPCYECSNCHEINYIFGGTPEENNYNYCPNCGAKMESEDKQ